MNLYVNIEDGIKFRDFIEMSNWDLEELGEDFFKLIGIGGETHLIEYHQNDNYYRILSDIQLDLFVSG